MNDLEKIDLILRDMYMKTRDGGMMFLDDCLNTYGVNVEPTEKQTLVKTIEAFGYGVQQVGRTGYRRQITVPKGVSFVETSSFSSPGTSILNL